MQRHVQRPGHFAWAAAATVVLLLPGSGCSSSSAPARQDQHQARGGLTDQLPSLTVLASAASPCRRVSDTQTQIDGDGAVLSGGLNNHTDALNHILYIIPGSDEDLAWAAYTLPDCNLDRPVQLNVEAQVILPGSDEDLPMNYWLMYSDYSSLNWRLAPGPNADQSHSGPASVVLNSAARRERVVSAQGASEPAFSFALVAVGNAYNSPAKAWDAQPRVAISFSTTLLRPVSDASYLATLPHHTPLSSVRSGLAVDPDQEVRLDWLLIDDPVKGSACQCASFEVWRWKEGSAGPEHIGDVAWPAASFVDPTDNLPGSADPEPGAGYRYYLHSVNAAGRSITLARVVHSGGWRADLAGSRPSNLSSKTSVAQINGAPAIAHRTSTDDGLWLLLESATGSGQFTEVLVDSGSSIGWEASLAEVDGKPAIAHYNNAGSHLIYSYCATADGLGAWTSVPLEVGGLAGSYCSLAVIAGCPAISYYASATQDLKYAWSSQPDGSSGWNSITVESTGEVGTFTSLALVDGRPAISYRDITVGSQALMYAISSTADGSAGWSSIEIDTSSTTVGEFSSLALINGNPAIAYFDNDNDLLKYAFSSTPDGASSTDWSLVVVDNGSTSQLALAEIGGHPAIAYQRNVFPHGLKFARSSLPDGSSGWSTQAISGQGGTGCDLAEVGGRGVISCMNLDPNDTTLKQVQRLLLD